MILTEREHEVSQVYSRFQFIKKEGLTLSLIMSLAVTLLKIYEIIKNKDYYFNSRNITIIILSAFIIILGGLISATVRYEIYNDKSNNLGKVSYILQYFINFYMTILAAVIMSFNSKPKEILINIVISIFFCSFISTIAGTFMHTSWSKNFITKTTNSITPKFKYANKKK